MSRLSSFLAGMAATVCLSSVVIAAPAPQSPSLSDQRAFDHTYLVFFGDGKASLTPEAREILHSAARMARGMRQAKVQVMVAADGPQGAALAKGRAQSVRAELVHDGLTPRAIVDANPPQDVSFANADSVIRAWLDRRAVILVSPVPDAGAAPETLAAR